MARVDNNYFTYRETPTTENGTGTFESIKGNTVNWNQLVSSTTGWASTNGTLSQSGDTYTYTITALGDYDYHNRIQRRFPTVIPQGHKILVSCEFYYPRAVPINIFLIRQSSGNNRAIGGTTVANTWTKISGIISEPTEFLYFQLALNTNTSTGFSVGESVQVRNPMAIDLTQMFGSTKADEIYAMEQSQSGSGVAYFRSLFPLSYYPYSSGELISFNGNGIRTVGKNRLSSVVNGAISPQGTISSSTTRLITNVMRITENTMVFSGTKTGKTLQSYGVYFVDYPNGNETGVTGAWTDFGTTINIPSGYKYVMTMLRYSDNSAISPNDISNLQAEFGSVTSYALYEEHTTYLPVSEYFPTGMKNIIGTDVYDELTRSKANTRISRTDLGSLTWEAQTTNGSEYRMVSRGINTVVKLPSASSEVANIMCSKYVSISSDAVYLRNTGISITTSGGISIYDPNYNTSSSVSAFTTAMAGIYLDFELATPTETDINLDLTYPIDKGGTEELLPSSLLNGVVDLGSLNWTYNSSADFMVSSVLPTPSITSGMPNAMLSSDEYSLVRADSLSNVDKGFTVYTARAYFKGTGYTNASSFKQAMQGTLLYFQNTDSTPYTSPILADIFYRGMIPVSVTVYPLGAGTVTGAGQYRYHETVTLEAESNDGIYRFLRYEDENGDTLSTNPIYSFEAGE